MASGFVYRCWTNDNRGSSGKFLFFVSVTIGCMVMFMVTKASAFVATVTTVSAGNHKFLQEKESFAEPTVRKASITSKAKRIAKHMRKHAPKKHLAKWRPRKARYALARRPKQNYGHSLGSQSAENAAESVGVASWYGPGFHGRRTASGTVYNMNEMTAAHKSLPFGTKLLVKNKATGKSAIVTITDRGPYIGKRVLDLSKEAARQLHMIRSGIGQVEYTILKDS